MALDGICTKSMFSSDVGTIGTSETFEKVQKFDQPANIMALPILRKVSFGDDEASVNAYIKSYVDGGKTHSSGYSAIVASSCTRIVWACHCDHAFTNPLRLIIYL